MYVESPAGEPVPCDKLGPGLVDGLEAWGTVRVRWIVANFELCMQADELVPLGRHAHLVSVYRIDKRRHTRNLEAHRLVDQGGLEYNWEVERMPDHLVRVIRTSDGSSWTFKWNALFRRIQPLNTAWVPPQEDDEAEAQAVAEITMGH